MKVRGCYISITLSRFVLKCEVVLDNILVNKYTISMFMRPLFWLRMGLYSDRRNGAAGAVTNCAPSQEVSMESMEPYLKTAPMEET